VPGGDITVDGIYGPITEGKTERFQRSQDIAVDGIVGPRTWSAMRDLADNGGADGNGEQPPPVLSRGDVGPAVETWQDHLNHWLSTARPEQGRLASDGIYGPRTEAVTIDLQRAAVITVDGIVGPETRIAVHDEIGGDV